MKSRINAVKTKTLKQFLLLIFAALIAAISIEAQIFSTLHYFDGGDGDGPFAGMIFSSNMLFGTTAGGGKYNCGTVFAIHTDGTGFTNLYNFTGDNDGTTPLASLTMVGNKLYGTAWHGGTNRVGSVFAINTDGTDFTNLYSFSAGSTNSLGNFTNSDGADPEASLTLSSNVLYGTAFGGGTNGSGTVFAIGTDGTGFTNLYDFTGGNDGANPIAGLVLSSNTLYGTTKLGGIFSNGTVFAVSTGGTEFTNLYDFTGGNDGGNPVGNLILSDSTLYGTTFYGGTNGWGTVFAVSTGGTGFTNLYDFTGGNDGGNPVGGLVLSSKVLLGTTFDGGTNDWGTVFAINLDGTGFTNLWNFNYYDGEDSQASLLLSDNTLYGTAFEGGSGADGNGTVFALSLGPIPLNVQTIGQNQTITWGNPAFSLQTASVLAGPWTTLSNAASPYTVNTVNAQAFFQLVSTNDP